MEGQGSTATGGPQAQLFSDTQLISLAAAAHDLKSPLTTVHYLSAMLQDSSLELTRDERDDYLLKMQLSAQAGLRLIDSLSQAAAVHRYQLELEPVNVAVACEDVLHEFGFAARKLSQTMELQVAPGAALAIAHHGALKNVLANLIDNSLKHNPAEGHIRIRVGHAGGRVVTTIRDQGPQVRIGDFRRLKKQLGRQLHPLGARTGSSGLGVYIANSLSEAMQGRLELTRHRHTGVTFRVALLPSAQLSFL